jgi:HAMP domain-containing protein
MSHVLSFLAGALVMFAAVVAWFMWGLVESGRKR